MAVDYKKIVKEWLFDKNKLWENICALSIPLSVPTEIGDTLLFLGTIIDCKVYLRDFDPVCIEYSPEDPPVEGDNDQAEKSFGHDFMPDDTIWIDWDMKIGEYKFIILHESVEHWLMKNYKLKYIDAHHIANHFERLHRIKYPNK